MSLLWAASTAVASDGHHWSIAPLPHHIKRLISPSLGVSADGSVYLFGGRDLGTTLLSDTCYKYSLDRGMWEEVGSTHPRPPPRAGATLVGAGGDLLLFGGRRDRPRSAALQPADVSPHGRAIVPCIRDGDEGVRSACVHTLGRMEPAALGIEAPAIALALEHATQQPYVRRAAVQERARLCCH